MKIIDRYKVEAGLIVLACIWGPALIVMGFLIYNHSAGDVSTGETDEAETISDAYMAFEQDRMMAAWDDNLRSQERAREAYENGRVAGFGLSYPWSSSGIRYPPEWGVETTRAMAETETGLFLTRFGAMIYAARSEDSVDLGEHLSAPVSSNPSNSGTHWYQDRDQEWTVGVASGAGCPCTSRDGKWISDVDGEECS